MGPLKAVLFLVASLACVAWTSSAEACRMNRPPSDRVRMDFDAVAIGVVTQSAPNENDHYDGRGWTATVRVTRPVEGRPADLKSLNLRYQISRTGDSASCDDGQTMPSPGETWVIYFTSREDELVASLSYPLSLARRIDPRFGDRGS